MLPLDPRTSTEGVLDAELPLVLHDALCPMTPPEFIAECVRRAVEADVVVAGVRPVTDTVKVLRDGLVGETLDRETLARVVSPVVVPEGVVAAVAACLAEPGPDLADLVEALRERDDGRAARGAGGGDARVRARGPPRAGGAQPSGVSSRSARSRSPANVILRLAGVEGTAAMRTSAYLSRQDAVSVPVNPSRSAAR